MCCILACIRLFNTVLQRCRLLINTSRWFVGSIRSRLIRRQVRHLSDFSDIWTVLRYYFIENHQLSFIQLSGGKNQFRCSRLWTTKEIIVITDLRLWIFPFGCWNKSDFKSNTLLILVGRNQSVVFVLLQFLWKVRAFGINFGPHKVQYDNF